MSDVWEITVHDQEYPPSLRDLGQLAPERLWLSGLREIPSRERRSMSEALMKTTSVGVVGSRRGSSYGEQVAGDLGYGCARSGVTVVSGLAVGIDAAAHWGAIDAQGPTIAVLGCGVDFVYPKANRPLRDRILSTGLLISEYPLGSRPLAFHFPKRNRIISALSDALVVVEGERKSGAMITAAASLEIGKQVLAVPGSIYSPLSRGTHELIRDGAAPVQSVEDVLEVLGVAWPEADMPLFSRATTPPLAGLEATVMQAMEWTTVTLDELLDRLDEETSVIVAALSRLELSGWVRREVGSKYFRLR